MNCTTTSFHTKDCVKLSLSLSLSLSLYRDLQVQLVPWELTELEACKVLQETQLVVGRCCGYLAHDCYQLAQCSKPEPEAQCVGVSNKEREMRSYMNAS